MYVVARRGASLSCNLFHVCSVHKVLTYFYMYVYEWLNLRGEGERDGE